MDGDATNFTALAAAARPFGLNVSGDVLETILASQHAEWEARWARYAAKMRECGFDPDDGALLLLPSNCIWLHVPSWARVTHLVESPCMMRDPLPKVNP